MAHLEATQIDPNREHLGKIYAKALLGAAEKSGDQQAVVEQLESFVGELLEQLPRLAEFLQAPRVSASEKLGVIERAFGKQMAPTLLRFLMVVARRGRMDSLREMAIAARKLYNELNGIVDVVVSTAFPLDDDAQERVQQALRRTLNQQIQLHVEVDSQLLGGIVLRIGDRVYDGSVIAQLNRMRQQIREQTFQQIRTAIDRFAGGA